MNNDKQVLKDQIKSLKENIISTVNEKENNLLDEEVQRMSRLLDEKILNYMKIDRMN